MNRLILRIAAMAIGLPLMSACAAPLSADQPAVGQPAAGQASAPPAKLGLCVGCHGANGMASLSGYPHLAGQDLEYLRSSVAKYRDGERVHAAMRASVNAVTKEDLDSIVVYYAGLPREGGL